jgi:hypothetical protein
MFGFFQWIRSRVRLAVLAGLEDAAAELDGAGEPTAALEALRQRLAPLPPPPATEVEGNGDATPVATGRRRKGGE